MEIKIPKRFFDDHVERGLPAPNVLADSATQYTIDTEHEDFAELIDDAKYYADKYGPDCCPGIKSAAKRLLKRLAHLSHHN